MSVAENATQSDLHLLILKSESVGGLLPRVHRKISSRERQTTCPHFID